VGDIITVLHWSLWQKKLKRGLFNLGTGKARTFVDLANAVFSSLGVEPNIEFIDTPEDIREQYQYFTEAKMEKLREHYRSLRFFTLEHGVKRYVDILEGSS
jgi:ADP-L-glycero-D-manno-heptose 6-epimerase